jgi:2-dehydropantoate 2-reductase
MDAWQKTHVAIISPLANAIYMAGNSGTRLAQMREAVDLAITAIREGFTVLQALRVPITPARWRIISWIPQSMLTSRMCAWAKTEQFQAVAVSHAISAADEMRTLADEFKDLALRTSVLTPAIDKLRTFIPPRAITAAA